MATQATLIEPTHEQVLEFCSRDPVERVFLEDVARRGLGHFYAVERGDGRLEALCHVGANLVPSGEGCARFAEAVHIAKHSDQKLHIGPIVSSDLFYNPNEGQYERWSSRGVLAVEMEAAALFTVGAIRSVQAGCLLTVSDIVVEGVFTRISDEELRVAVDRMTRVALATVTAGH